MAIQFRLNTRKPGNYAFFCPVTRLHLTLANPVNSVNRVSNYILRGIKSKSIIDIDGVINLETGELNTKPVEKEQSPTVELKEQKTIEPEKQEVAATQDQKEEEPSQVVEVAVEEKKTQKRGKRAQGNPVDEAATE